MDDKQLIELAKRAYAVRFPDADLRFCKYRIEQHCFVDYIVVSGPTGIAAVFRILGNGERFQYVRPEKYPETMRSIA